MSVLVETDLGSLTIDVHAGTDGAPRAARSFLKLCKAKYYHGCLFFNIQSDFVAQTGDPTGTGRGGSSLDGLLHGEQARFMEDEFRPHLRHSKRGTVSLVRYSAQTPDTLGSQWIVTLRNDCASLDDMYTVFGEVVDGWDTLDKLNAAFCDGGGRPLVDVRIRHTYVLLDPFDDPAGMDALLPAGDESPSALRPKEEVCVATKAAPHHASTLAMRLILQRNVSPTVFRCPHTSCANLFSPPTIYPLADSSRASIC